MTTPRHKKCSSSAPSRRVQGFPPLGLNRANTWRFFL